MRTYFPGILSVAIVSILTLSVLVPLASAYEEVLDQRQLDGTNTVTAYSGFNHNQTFQPTKNVLTKLEVKMKYRQAGSNVTLMVKDEVTGQTVVNVTQRMGADEGWETFVLVGDELGYILDTSHSHSIWIGTDYYPNPPYEHAPSWLYTASDLYALGTRRQGASAKTGDLTFATYGYDIDMGRDNPEPPDQGDPEPPAEDPEEADTPVDSGTPDSTPEEAGQPGSSEVPDTATDAVDTVVEEDESMTPPVFEGVAVDDKVVNIEEGGELEVEKKSKVKILGTAEVGDTVVVVIGEKAYTATADTDGNWYVVFSASDLENGSYMVKAQAQNSEGKGSKMVEFFTLEVGGVEVATTEAAAVSVEVEPSLWERLTKGNMRFVSIGLLVLLGVGIYLGFFYYKKKKGKKQPSNPDDQKPKVPKME